MSKDDWFRVPCLTQEAKEQFEQSLTRSRSSRPEYIENGDIEEVKHKPVEKPE